MLAELESNVDEEGAPDKGPGEGVNGKFGEVDMSYPSRKRNVTTHDWQQATKEGDDRSVATHPPFSYFKLTRSNEYSSPAMQPGFDPRLFTNCAEPIANERSDSAADGSC